jgi:response regulator RpfG family c-di-GMP phosphodiesterase
VRDLMSRWVSALGLDVRVASNAEQALEQLNERHSDLAVIDIMMPGKTGLWLAGELRRDHPHTAVVLATAYTQLLDGSQEHAVADLLIKPFQRERFVLAMDRGRQWRQEAIAELAWHAQLSAELTDRVSRVRDELVDARRRGLDEEQVLTTLTTERVPDVAEHSERVVQSSIALARDLQLEESMARDIGVAARFHDVGKIAVPDPLLTKPSPLTPGELAIMRRHVDAGADILAATERLAAVAPIVRATHEWFGGGGYPAKLTASDIPLASRIVAICDAYDAMTHDDRAYRMRLDSNEAVAELLRCASAQFDPDLVVAFLTVLGRH